MPDRFSMLTRAGPAFAALSLLPLLLLLPGSVGVAVLLLLPATLIGAVLVRRTVVGRRADPAAPPAGAGHAGRPVHPPAVPASQPSDDRHRSDAAVSFQEAAGRRTPAASGAVGEAAAALADHLDRARFDERLEEALSRGAAVAVALLELDCVPLIDDALGPRPPSRCSRWPPNACATPRTWRRRSPDWTATASRSCWRGVATAPPPRASRRSWSGSRRPPRSTART